MSIGLFKGLAQYHAIYVPDDKLSKIKIDGNLEDWDWVPQNYFITNEEMIDQINRHKKYDVNDLGIKLIVGWNKNKNWLYIVAKIIDDLNKANQDAFTGRYDDALKIAIDADNSGGYYADSKSAFSERAANAIQFYFATPPKEGFNEFGNFPELEWLSKKSQVLDWGWKVDSTLQGGVIKYYELGMALWDYIDVSEITSKRHHMNELETIGLTISMYDTDKETHESKWFTLSGQYFYIDANDFSKFILDAPINNGNLWQSVVKVVTP